jgi:DNA-binding beta-propeller fold protein YncE
MRKMSLPFTFLLLAQSAWLLMTSCAGTLQSPRSGGAAQTPCPSEIKHLFSFGSSGTMPGQFRSPASVSLDSFGNLLVADTGNSRIQKFDSSGRFLMEFGGLGSSEGSLDRPTDCVENSLSIYVVDSAKQSVLEFDSNGRFLSVCVSREKLGEQYPGFEPTNIAFSDAGYVFVGDADADAVMVFSRFWDPVAVVGGFGAGEGRFSKPGGMTVDRHGELFVCDTGNDRVQVLSSTGNFLRDIRVCAGEPGCEPGDVAIGTDGATYVADAGLGRVIVLDKDGNVGCAVDRVPDESFMHPRSVAISHTGVLYVLDGGTDEVHVFQTSSMPAGSGSR